MKTVSEFLADWKVYGDDKEFVAELETFQAEAFHDGLMSARDSINAIRRELERERNRLNWLLPRQRTHQTRESIDKEIEDFHARNASPF